MEGAERARKKLISWRNPKGKLLISPLREPGLGTSLQGSLWVQGCTPLLSAQPGSTHTTVTSFPQASKISSSFGQNLATPGAMGREPWQEPATPQSAGNGCWSSGARVLHRHFPWDGRVAQLRAQAPNPACPELLSSVCPLSSPSPMAAPAQDLLFPVLVPHTWWGTASTAACRHPHGLSCSWSGLSWLPTNTIYLTPRVLLVSSVIDLAFPW